MDKNLPLTILMLIPILMVLRILFYLNDNRTNEIKTAKSVAELTFSNYSIGYSTNGFLHRFVYVFVVYVSFLSIFDFTSLLPYLFVTLLMLTIGFMVNHYDWKVLRFYNDSFTVEKYINFFGSHLEFSYSKIDKIEYYIAGAGTAELRIYQKDGFRKKISFRPSFLGQDDKLIKLIFNEKVKFEVKYFKFRNYFD
jgi:hypothetical protein